MREDVIIYSRYIRLDVVVPEPYVWEFMQQFGQEFAVQDLEGSKNLKAVDSYHEAPAGWHIKISVFEGDENKFYDFLREFCEKREITFRDPRQNTIFENTIFA